MNDTDALLRRQADWQRDRQALSWPEKIRQAEQLRTSVEVFRRLRRQRSPDEPSDAPPETR
jgi:hypothetical protein